MGPSYTSLLEITMPIVPQLLRWPGQSSSHTSIEEHHQPRSHLNTCLRSRTITFEQHSVGKGRSKFNTGCAVGTHSHGTSTPGRRPLASGTQTTAPTARIIHGRHKPEALAKAESGIPSPARQ